MSSPTLILPRIILPPEKFTSTAAAIESYRADLRDLSIAAEALGTYLQARDLHIIATRLSELRDKLGDLVEVIEDLEYDAGLVEGLEEEVDRIGGLEDEVREQANEIAEFQTQNERLRRDLAASRQPSTEMPP